jgi:hypothetical protein
MKTMSTEPSSDTHLYVPFINHHVACAYERHLETRIVSTEPSFDAHQYIPFINHLVAHHPEHRLETKIATIQLKMPADKVEFSKELVSKM